MDKIVRKESSIPVQGRISLVDLARMDRYWMLKEGVNIKSMSQLLSWTFTAMCDVIEANGKMPDDIKTVSDANRYLNVRGLYQQGMKKKGQSRIIAAMGFENLRGQGEDPAKHLETAYNTVHSKCSGGLYDGEVDIGQSKQEGDLSKEGVGKLIKKGKEEARERERYREEELSNALNSDLAVSNKAQRVNQTQSEADIDQIDQEGVTLKEGMSDEELDEHNRKRDEERIRLENQEVRASDFNVVRE